MNYKNAKPFLKWAGGKSQLNNDVKKALPKDVYTNKFHFPNGQAIHLKQSLHNGLFTSVPNAI